MATNQLLRPADLLHSFPKTDPLNRWQVHGTADAMVPMRDGVRLATDIWRPAHGDGSPVSFPVPVLLVRTSYDKQNPEWDDVVPYLVRRGIAVAIQDVRARYRSEGDGTYYHTCNPWEGPDGYDAVQWLAQQPWCDGQVGTFGSSHRAITQQQLVLHSPPALAAIFPEVGPTNIFQHEAREGGAFCFAMFAALHMHALDSHELRGNAEGASEVLAAMAHIDQWVSETPFEPGATALRHTPSLEQTLLDYYRRGTPPTIPPLRPCFPAHGGPPPLPMTAHLLSAVDED